MQKRTFWTALWPRTMEQHCTRPETIGTFANVNVVIVVSIGSFNCHDELLVSRF